MTDSIPNTKLFEHYAGPHIGNARNEWRERNVQVFEHKELPTMVITVGHPFNGDKPVICTEPREQWEHVIRVYPGTYLIK